MNFEEPILETNLPQGIDNQSQMSSTEITEDSDEGKNEEIVNNGDYLLITGASNFDIK